MQTIEFSHRLLYYKQQDKTVLVVMLKLETPHSHEDWADFLNTMALESQLKKRGTICLKEIEKIKASRL